MFFLITHITVGKYYPSFFTQFIIGCAFYAVSFLVLRDLISGNFYGQYRYHILFLIIIDASFLFYKAKTSSKSSEQITVVEYPPEEKKMEQISSDAKTYSIQSSSISSEMNDYKVVHDLSSSDNDGFNLFSSDQKDEEKSLSGASDGRTSEHAPDAFKSESLQSASPKLSSEVSI